MSIRMCIFLFCVLCRIGVADEADTHFAAHAGASFALTSMFYGAIHSAGMPRVPAIGFAAVATLFVGGMYKALEPGPAPAGTFERAMFQNVLGTGAAGISIQLFQF